MEKPLIPRHAIGNDTGKMAWILAVLLAVFLFSEKTTSAEPGAKSAATETAAAPEGQAFAGSIEPCTMVLPASLRASLRPEMAAGTINLSEQLAISTIFTEDFEGGWPGVWTVSGDPTWGADDFKPCGGAMSLWCAKGGSLGRDPATSDYADSMEAWAIYGPFDLTDTTSGGVTFNYWSDTAFGYDYFEYGLSDNGTTFASLHQTGQTGSSYGWVQAELDYDNIPGQPTFCGKPQVWLGFRFHSDSSGADQGTFIDNLRIRNSSMDLVALDVYPGDASGNEFPTSHTINPGDTIYLCFKYWCDGEGWAPEFWNEIWLDGQRKAYLGQVTSGGVTRVIRCSWTAELGDHTVEGRLDVGDTYGRRLNEANETNNIRTESPCFTVSLPGPNIRVTPTALNFTVASVQTTPSFDNVGTKVVAVSNRDFASAERLPDGRILVWVAPTLKADLTALETAISVAGGKVLSLAPEGKLLVALAAGQAQSLAADGGVASIQPYVVQDLGGDPNAGHPPGMGERPPTPEEEEYIRNVYTQVHRVGANTLSVQRAKLQGMDAAPAAADNTLSQYFPPVRSQGNQNSCTCWSSGYYYNTYAQARDENLLVSTGDNNNICSPAFMYPLVNGGTNTGVNTAVVVARLTNVGCCSWALKPYVEGDWTSWPSEAAWIDALKRRTVSAHNFDLTTDTGLAALKQHLANGNIAVTRTTIYGNWWPTFHNNEGRGIQNGVLFSHTGETSEGGHAMTVVGYNDNRSYFDGTTTRTGALLIANSWGTAWGTYNSTGGGSKGFMWVSYDYVKAVNDCFDVAYYNDDRDNYRPRLYAAAGLNHAKRGFVAHWGGVGSVSAPAWSSYMAINQDGGTTLPIQDAKRVVVDLTEGIPSITNFTSISLFVNYWVAAAAGANGTITSAQFYHDFDGDGTFVDISSTNPTVTVTPGHTGSARVHFSAFSNSKTFFICNDGNMDLNVTDVTARDGDPWLNWSPRAPMTIGPGSSRAITVTVDLGKAAPGLNDERLIVFSNDPDENPYPDALFVTLQSSQISYTLTVTSAGNGRAKVNGMLRTLPWSAQLASSATIHLEAVPTTGWTFHHWSGDLTGTSNPAYIRMTGNKTVTANFTDLVAPSAPGIPRDAGDWTSTTVRFDWVAATDTGSGIASYDLQVGTAPGGSNVFNANVGNVPTKTVLGTHGQRLYARVRARDRAGNMGPWSGNSNGITVDGIAPRLTYAKSLDRSTLLVTFSEDMKNGDQAANYLCTGGVRVFAATRLSNRQFRLTTTDQGTSGTCTLMISENLKDRAGNSVDAAFSMRMFGRGGTTDATSWPHYR